MITLGKFRKEMKGRVLQRYTLIDGGKTCVQNNIIEAVSYAIPAMKHDYRLRLKDSKFDVWLNYQQMYDLHTHGYSCEAPAEDKGLRVWVTRLIKEGEE